MGIKFGGMIISLMLIFGDYLILGSSMALISMWGLKEDIFNERRVCKLIGK